MKVWVAVANYGLNGAGVVRVYLAEPSRKQIDELENEAFEGQPYSHRDVTGFAGIHVEEMDAT